MHTGLVVLLVWIGVSVLLGVGFSLGAVLGYRRGLQEGLEARRGARRSAPSERSHAHEVRWAGRGRG